MKGIMVVNNPLNKALFWHWGRGPGPLDSHEKRREFRRNQTRLSCSVPAIHLTEKARVVFVFFGM